MPKQSCCCLSSINLGEFVKNPYTKNARFDIEDFKKAVHIGIRALDKLIGENASRHPLQAQRDISIKYRNIGLGVMGFATALMKLGIKYGSKESIDFTDKLFDKMFVEAVFESNKLASEFGAFPGYKECIFDSRIIKKHFDEYEIKKLKKYGLRNASLLSIAPTGSLSSLLGVSGGAEPQYAISFTRRTVGMTDNQDKYYTVYCDAAKEYMKVNNTDKLPDYFIGSADVDWRDRVKIQAAMQKHIDTAISSTVNLKNSATKEDVEGIYLMAWKEKLKGITIFRDGCKRLGILTTDKTPKKEEDENSKFNAIKPISRKQMGVTHGDTYCKKCACGTLYITVNRDDEGNLVEIFVHTSKGGICQANISALTRLASLSLRSGVLVDEVIDQLRAISCPACNVTRAKGKPIDGMSCPDIISRVLQSAYDKKRSESKQVKEEQSKEKSEHIHEDYKCPECGAKLSMSGGCRMCSECGWSKCE